MTAMSWIDHHSQSERYALQAEAASKSGHFKDALELYRQAAQEEEAALDALDAKKQRTLAITAVSAASLWLKAKNFRAVEKTACRWIASDLLPAFATLQLQAILGVSKKETAETMPSVECSSGDAA